MSAEKSETIVRTIQSAIAQGKEQSKDIVTQLSIVNSRHNWFSFDLPSFT